MRNLAPLFALVVVAVALPAMSPPPVEDLVLSQTRCSNGTAVCLGDKNTKVKVGGNLSVSSPDGGFVVSDTGAVTVPSVKVKSGGTAVTQILAFSSTIDFATGTTTCTESSGITVTGALAGDSCIVGPPSTGGSTNAAYTCYVSAADTVKVRHCPAGTADDPASATFKGFVISSQ
jgi:hypothetical protein